MVPLQLLSLCALTVSWYSRFGPYHFAREIPLSCRVQASNPEILFPLPFCCHRSLCISDSDFLLFHFPGVLMLIHSYTLLLCSSSCSIRKVLGASAILYLSEDLYIFESYVDCYTNFNLNKSHRLPAMSHVDSFKITVKLKELRYTKTHGHYKHLGP